jgi:catechol 2,3-dioxygenase-like lactoylglutathione lyase family enzyme
MARTPLCPHLMAARRQWRSADEDAGHEVRPRAPHRRAPQTLLIGERDRRALGNTQMCAAGIRAIKFHDPEHHDLELISYPPGKGDPFWQRPTHKLFLGVTHTAMTVESTEPEVAFYRDLLGLQVGGVTLNSGETQEVLDNLFNDTCLVTELMPPSGPAHIELLDYKTPPGGRPMPADTAANDLWHWQTTLVTKDIAAVAARLRKASVRFVTPDVLAVPEEAQAQLGFKKALMVRDPSGHAIRLVEE